MAYYVHRIKEINRLNREIKAVELDLLVLDCTPSRHRAFQRKEKDSRELRSRLMKEFYVRSRS